MFLFSPSNPGGIWDMIMRGVEDVVGGAIIIWMFLTGSL